MCSYFILHSMQRVYTDNYIGRKAPCQCGRVFFRYLSVGMVDFYGEISVFSVF